MCQHSFVKNWGLDWVCASLLWINMVWWGFVLSYEPSVVLMHWKRTATESCICCFLMCITKLVKSRQITPTCIWEHLQCAFGGIFHWMKPGMVGRCYAYALLDSLLYSRNMVIKIAGYCTRNMNIETISDCPLGLNV
jgi:hypothetical protein